MSTESKRDDRPKKKKKKKPSKTGLYIGLGIGGVVLLLILIGAGVLMVMKPWDRGGDKKNNVAQNPAPPMPQPADHDPNRGRAVVRNPKTLLGNIRARGDQIERDAEMRGIVNLYTAYCDEIKSPAGRNKDGFLVSIRSEPAKLVNAVKSNDYFINFKARPGTDDIVVFETEKYDRGYYCVTANVQMSYLSADEMKAAGLPTP